MPKILMSLGYAMALVGSLGMLVFARKFSFATNFSDHRFSGEHFLGMNGEQVWKWSWAFIILGILLQLGGTWLPGVSRAQPRTDPALSAAQSRVDAQSEFSWKERCAIAADRIDKHFKDGVSQAFYSPKRNSCVCEAVSMDKGNSLHELFDCLTRESIADGLFRIGSTDLPQQLDAWQRKIDSLK